MEFDKIYECLIDIRERMARIEQAIVNNDARINALEARIETIESRMSGAMGASLLALLGFLFELVKELWKRG